MTPDTPHVVQAQDAISPTLHVSGEQALSLDAHLAPLHCPSVEPELSPDMQLLVAAHQPHPDSKQPRHVSLA